MPNKMSVEACVPVAIVETGSAYDGPDAARPGIALCLSGGGYRALLFHLGSLWRLNEFGYLPKLTQISSVSSGSIAAAMLGFKWPRLNFNSDGVAANFQQEVIRPVRELAGTTIDEGSILGGLLLPGSIADKVTAAYRTHLFGRATLQDLPDGAPRIVITATSVQTGVLFRFSRASLADYRVGRVPNPTVELAVAVAASSAFPPVLSPLELQLDEDVWAPPSGQTFEDLHRPPYLTRVTLTDGGVYDNLGLETAWKKYQTVLVSNGGGRVQPEPQPSTDWPRHSLRIAEIIDDQVRTLRVRQVINSFEAQERRGTYWGMRVNLADYDLPDALPCPIEKTLELAQEVTRLKGLDCVRQEQLINWGYAACDTAMRKWVDSSLRRPSGFPYPASGVG